MNACSESVQDTDFRALCKKWYGQIDADTTLQTYAKYWHTSAISRAIRQYTVYKALALCKEFVERFTPYAPDFVLAQKAANSQTSGDPKIHTNIPNKKFCDRGGTPLCMNDQNRGEWGVEDGECDTIGDREGDKAKNTYDGTGGKSNKKTKRKGRSAPQKKTKRRRLKSRFG